MGHCTLFRIADRTTVITLQNIPLKLLHMSTFKKLNVILENQNIQLKAG